MLCCLATVLDPVGTSISCQSGTHISLRETYMTRRRDFLELADVESRTLCNREFVCSLASRMSSEGPRGTRRRELAELSL